MEDQSCSVDDHGSPEVDDGEDHSSLSEDHGCSANDHPEDNRCPILTKQLSHTRYRMLGPELIQVYRQSARR